MSITLYAFIYVSMHLCSGISLQHIQLLPVFVQKECVLLLSFKKVKGKGIKILYSDNLALALCR